MLCEDVAFFLLIDKYKQSPMGISSLISPANWNILSGKITGHSRIKEQNIIKFSITHIIKSLRKQLLITIMIIVIIIVIIIIIIIIIDY